MHKITPILVVEEIEPSLALWVDRLGFRKSVEVPDGDKLAFVVLTRDNLEIMYQTKRSIVEEVDKAGLHPAMNATGASVLYVDVPDLAEIQQKVQGLEILVPYRKTFYGAEELWMREPGGHLVGFAAHPDAA